MQTYSTSQIADKIGIHSNTVRLYEKWGLISPAPRDTNNYRRFTDRHLYQIRLCRCIFGYPFTTRAIRRAGNQVIRSASQWSLAQCRTHTDEYLRVIRQEIARAVGTVEHLEQWLNGAGSKEGGETNETSKFYTRRQAAMLMGTTTETVRNWERNAMVFSSRTGSNHEVLYDPSALERMKIIHMLRSAGYSIFAIRRCLCQYDNGSRAVVLETLDRPGTEEDLMMVGDRWHCALLELEDAAGRIPLLLNEMETLH